MEWISRERAVLSVSAESSERVVSHCKERNRERAELRDSNAFTERAEPDASMKRCASESYPPNVALSECEPAGDVWSVRAERSGLIECSEVNV